VTPRWTTRREPRSTIKKPRGGGTADRRSAGSRTPTCDGGGCRETSPRIGRFEDALARRACAAGLFAWQPGGQASTARRECAQLPEPVLSAIRRISAMVSAESPERWLVGLDFQCQKRRNPPGVSAGSSLVSREGQRPASLARPARARPEARARVQT
jgi:hypothetical protein